MIDTVWKIGDTVYGVHSEVFNSTYYIYIVEEKIVYIKETGGYISEGKMDGKNFKSDSSSFDTFFDKNSDVNYAEKIYTEATIQSEQNNNLWKEVVRRYE